MSEHFPFEVIPFTKEEHEAFRKVYTKTPHDMIHVGPSRCTLPAAFMEHAANIYKMPLRSDDTVVVTFPRSGTTWTQELVWLVANNLNFDKAKAVPLTERYAFIEVCMFFNKKMTDILKQQNADKPGSEQIINELHRRGYEILANTKSPRFIKTHLPISLLPPALLDTCKTVYVARDPRDVAVSYYHFHKDNTLLGMSAPFKDYYELFEKDLMDWCPFFEHMKETWAQRHHPNMLFIFYEDMIKDLKSTACRVAEFFGKSYSEEQLAQLCNHLQFDNFKKNASVDLQDFRKAGIFEAEKKNFIRKGKSGGWRDYFDEELTARVQLWMDRHLRDTDLRFPQ